MFLLTLFSFLFLRTLKFENPIEINKVENLEKYIDQIYKIRAKNLTLNLKINMKTPDCSILTPLTKILNLMETNCVLLNSHTCGFILFQHCKFRYVTIDSVLNYEPPKVKFEGSYQELEAFLHGQFYPLKHFYLSSLSLIQERNNLTDSFLKKEWKFIGWNIYYFGLADEIIKL